ncbi:MAG TPA: type VI secretion system-associated FHA domain protein, partial [Polyangiaceae bacterium]|nr:type VI secretion system-associated FHA domain protein [Polyangiaceae bacterium]
SSVRVQVVDPSEAPMPWRAGGGSNRPAVDSFLDAPVRGGQGVQSLPDLNPPGGSWDRPPDPPRGGGGGFGDGPLSLPPLPGERQGGSGSPRRDDTPLGRSYDSPGGGFGRNPEPPPPVRGFDPPPPVRGGYEPPPPVRGFEPVGGGYGHAPRGDASPHLATGNFQLSIETLALQGLRELVGSLMPGQQLTTQGDVARLITRLHDAIDVLCRTLIPLRQSYLKFISNMDLQKSAHFAQASAVLDMARDPAAVAGALLDFREQAPEMSKALETALNDLTTHQVAMLDGVMQGVRALLDELAPSAVSEAAENKRGGFRLGGREKDIWDEYCERYARVDDDSEAFSKIFGEEFAQAYRRYRRR